MKSILFSILFIISSFFYFSCTKPRTNEFAVPEYQLSIKSCACAGNSNKEQFRFEAVINGQHVCFDRLWYPYNTSLGLWMKTWRDAIYTERINANSTIAIRMQYDNPSFKQFPLPYLLNDSIHGNCEFINIEIINLFPFKMCECSADDSYYVARTAWPRLTVQIISYNENIIEGSFKGNFINRGEKEIPVTDGYFKINLRTEEDSLTSQVLLQHM